MRHDRQQLHAGKSFRLQTESETDGKVGGHNGDPYRLPERPAYTSALRGMASEKLESRLSEALPGLDGVVSSLRGASKITISEESRRLLGQEGEAICRKIADRIDKESANLLDRLSVRDRVVISATAFWCMIEVIIFLLAAFICTWMANARVIHSGMLWKVLGYSAGFLVLCIALTIFTCHKLKH